MILRQLGSNQTELSLNNGSSIFFSYETPVAGFDPEDGFFKTETYYSKTTSRHINQYFKHVDAGDITIVPDQYNCTSTTLSPRIIPNNEATAEGVTV